MKIIALTCGNLHLANARACELIQNELERLDHSIEVVEEKETLSTLTMHHLDHYLPRDVTKWRKYERGQTMQEFGFNLHDLTTARTFISVAASKDVAVLVTLEEA